MDNVLLKDIHDSKVHGANMGHIWDRQVPGGPHVGPMNLAILDVWEKYMCMLLSSNESADGPLLMQDFPGGRYLCGGY